jgi:hypothetical protein
MRAPIGGEATAAAGVVVRLTTDTDAERCERYGSRKDGVLHRSYDMQL